MPNVSDEPKRYIDEKAEICENRENFTKQNVSLDPLMENNFLQRMLYHKKMKKKIK